jgi:hypothetical protein
MRACKADSIVQADLQTYEQKRKCVAPMRTRTKDFPAACALCSISTMPFLLPPRLTRVFSGYGFAETHS